MEKRHFNRKRCLASAVAAVGLSALAYNANATLTLELVEPGGSPNGAASSYSQSNQNPFNLDVWATVSGTGSGRQGLQIAEMSFTSSGTSLGNFAGAMPLSPWNANGAQAGSTYGSAGDLDLGSTNPALAAGHWIAISDEVQGNGANSATYQVKLGTITFDPTADGTGSLSLVPRATTSGALWFEDATVTTPGGNSPPVWTGDKNQSTGTITPFGINLTITGAVVSSPTWAATGGGSWSNVANWQGGTQIPLNTDVVTFGGSITAPSAVTLDGSRTTAGLRFDNSNSYTIAQGSGGTLTVSGSINTVTGSHTISAPLTLSGVVTKSGTGTLVLSGTQSHGSGAGLTVTAGNVNVNSDLANGGTPNLNVSVTGGTLTFSPAVPFNSVKSLDADENAAGTALIKIPNSAVNFGDAIVAITPGGAGVTRGLLESTYIDMVFGAPSVDGTKGITLQTANPAVNRVIMIDDNVNTGSILLLESISGDLFGDSSVDGNDVSQAAFYQDDDPASHGFGLFTSMEGDINYDGVIDGNDVSGVAFFQNQSFNPANASGGVTAVPEPASLGILGIGATALLRRRRRA